MTVDGEEAEIVVSGTDRGYTVTRVVVEIDPGQTRTVEATVVDPTSPNEEAPTVHTQPMVIPATPTVGDYSPCSGS